MFISNVTDRGSTPALVKTLAYNEARMRVIAANVANYDTPGYKAKRLDPKVFQQALGAALKRRGDDPNKPFVLGETDPFATRPDGTLKVTPTEEPVENVLFHDGTNISIERQMADLAETTMAHELASSLFRGRMDGLRKAIRGYS